MKVLFFICLLIILLILIIKRHENFEVPPHYIDSLRVYKTPFPKIRIGKDHDGGYIISDIPHIKYDCLISGGISNDISFEEDFLEKYNIKCIAFDGSIDKLPKDTTYDITFVKKYLGEINNEDTSNIRDLLDLYDNIFLKLDIEGGEYNLFKTFTENDLNKFSQITIEFHDPKNFDILNRLKNTHWLIHFHGNNTVGIDKCNHIHIPQVYECTFINKKYVSHVELNDKNIPDLTLDMPNTLDTHDIQLSGYPYTK